MAILQNRHRIYLGLLDTLTEIGKITSFLGRFFKEVFLPPFRFEEILKQSHYVMFKSLALVSITSFVMGLVLVIQSRPSLVQFGAGAFLPAMAAASIVREIGPLITALVCAGNIGSSICAELGSMKVTEQIDAMEVSGANPFKFLVTTRMVATTLMVPLLAVYADAISLMGAYFGANIKSSISLYLFFTQVFEKLAYGDVVPAVTKTFFFGLAIGLIGCYKGYVTPRGTEDVGKAANSAVIVSLFLIIIIDMIATQIASILNLV